jgi:hypothetical protein
VGAEEEDGAELLRSVGSMEALGATDGASVSELVGGNDGVSVVGGAVGMADGASVVET